MDEDKFDFDKFDFLKKSSITPQLNMKKAYLQFRNKVLFLCTPKLLIITIKLDIWIFIS
jgi:hypothetical protein